MREYRTHFKFSPENSTTEKNPTRRVSLFGGQQNADQDTWLRDKIVVKAGAITQHVNTQRDASSDPQCRQ
jgi:hypothetical protein